MTRQKRLIFIPLAIIAVILVYCWTIILTTEISATWRQYLGLVFFIVIAFLFFKPLIKVSILSTGIYLLLATFNLLAITPTIDTYGIRFGDSISTPPIQLLTLGLFILYFWINLESLIDIHLDYKETKLKGSQYKKN